MSLLLGSIGAPRSTFNDGIAKQERADLGPTAFCSEPNRAVLRLRFQRVESMPYGDEESPFAGR